jgi:O-antigen/teichoic acid export membrane protein
MPQAELQAALAQSLVVLSGPVGLRLGAGLESVVAAQALTWGFLFAGGMLWEKRQPGGLDLRPRWDLGTYREAWHIVGWSVVAMAASGVVRYGDRFFSLGAGANEINAYGLASSLVLKVPSFLGMLGPLALPVIAAARRDPSRAAELQRTYVNVNMLGAAAACLPLAAGGAALLGVWGGGKFGPEIAVAAARWMPLLALGGFFLGLSQALSTALIGYGAVQVTAWAAMAGAAMGLGAGFAARSLGAPAAAWMAVAGEGTITVILAWALERRVLGRGGFGWALQLLPWGLGGSVGLWALRVSAFPLWFGHGFIGHLACFVLLGAAILIAGLLGEEQIARRRGHASLLEQARAALARRRQA